MAHKSKKKHIKHMKQHEQAAKAENGADAPVHRETSRRVKLASKAKAAPAAARAAVTARASKVRAKVGAQVNEKVGEKGGLVRAIARSAGEKITAKPKRMLSRAKARVRSLLGRDTRSAA